MNPIRHRKTLRARFLAAVLPATLAFAAGSAGAQRIPDALADTTFWRMVTQFSEPNGFFRSDNFVSNEAESQYVIPDLLRTVKRGGVYLGVGPEQNFTYVVTFRPRIAFICDIRRQNMLQHLMYKALMEMAPSRAEFLSRLWSRPKPAGVDSASTIDGLMRAYGAVRGDTALSRKNFAAILRRLTVTHRFTLTSADSSSLQYVYTAFFEGGPDLNYAFEPSGGPAYGSTFMPTFALLARETDGRGTNHGWLANEQRYRVLREYQARNLLVPIVGDFAGGSALQSIGNYVREHDATIDVFYVSNVEQYLFQQNDDWSKFYANVATLPVDSASVFIRSVSNFDWVPLRNPKARMAQVSSGVLSVLGAIQQRTANSYYDVVMLKR